MSQAFAKAPRRNSSGRLAAQPSASFSGPSFLQHAHQLVHHLVEIFFIDAFKQFHAKNRGQHLRELFVTDVPVTGTRSQQNSCKRLLAGQLGSRFHAAEQGVKKPPECSLE